MQSEIAYGDRPELTSLVGASAAPSHTPAPSPHSTPIPCTDRNCLSAIAVTLIARRFVLLFAQQPGNKREPAACPSMQRDQKRESDAENDERNQQVTIG